MPCSAQTKPSVRATPTASFSAAWEKLPSRSERPNPANDNESADLSTVADSTESAPTAGRGAPDHG
jgi:hypothetical protein